jgi:hypothetical protein
MTGAILVECIVSSHLDVFAAGELTEFALAIKRAAGTPRLILYAGLIHRALSNARIICVRRNPVDTCLSNYRQLFAARRSGRKVDPSQAAGVPGRSRALDRFWLNAFLV